MFAKIEITGKIVVDTGMHIGGSSEFAAIGAIDSPVIRDTFHNLPIIPGSSLKGKMRSLLAKRYNDKIVSEPNEDGEILLRLFGSSKKNHIQASRLIFSDAVMENKEELKEKGIISETEAKFENTINRLSAVANPRQIERVIRGAVFPLQIIYDIYWVEGNKEAEIQEDFQVIKEGLRLLEYDYLGGHGSRGYGKIHFENIDLELVVGELDYGILDTCQKILKDV